MERNPPRYWNRHKKNQEFFPKGPNSLFSQVTLAIHKHATAMWFVQSPGTDLHSLWVHPVLDVLHGLVHTQEDGLVTVIQTGGGTLSACSKHKGDKATG